MRSIRALTCFLALWSLILVGQTTRSVHGIVRDKAGNALPKVVVQIEDSITLQIRSFITRKDGSYYFEGLSPDITYNLVARYRKFSSDTKHLSKFDSSKQAAMDFIINVD